MRWPEEGWQSDKINEQKMKRSRVAIVIVIIITIVVFAAPSSAATSQNSRMSRKSNDSKSKPLTFSFLIASFCLLSFIAKTPSTEMQMVIWVFRRHFKCVKKTEINLDTPIFFAYHTNNSWARYSLWIWQLVINGWFYAKKCRREKENVREKEMWNVLMKFRPKHIFAS